MYSSLVSIITRTKNRSLLLRRAIESVLSQTFDDWEFIIVNDGGDSQPVDKLLNEYVTRLQGRMVVIHNSSSLGMEAASNVGLNRASGKYVVILDDDDSWAPEFLNKSVKYLEKTNNCRCKGVVSWSMRIVERIEGDIVLEQHRDSFNSWMDSVSLFRMAAENMFPPVSFLYCRDVVKEIGAYREDLPVLGDWEFNLRFLEKYEIGVIKEHLAYYHHRMNTNDQTQGANSVYKDSDLHRSYDSLLRNELLRCDLREGRFGLGAVVNLAKSIETLHRQVAQVDLSVAGLHNSRLRRALRTIYEKSFGAFLVHL